MKNEKLNSVRVRIGAETFQELQRMAEGQEVSIEEAMDKVREMVGDEIDAAIDRALRIIWWRNAGDWIEAGRFVPFDVEEA